MNNRKSKQRRGVTTVEFALAAPVFFLVLLTVFEFGWQVVIRHTADNAAYEAVRVAIVPGATADEAIAEATRIMNIVGARSFNIEVDPPVLDNETERVEVLVEGAYANNGIIASKFLSGINFQSRSDMLTERPRRD